MKSNIKYIQVSCFSKISYLCPLQFIVILKVCHVTFGPLVVIKQNCMYFAEEHCFGCASALHNFVDEYGVNVISPSTTCWSWNNFLQFISSL